MNYIFILIILCSFGAIFYLFFFSKSANSSQSVELSPTSLIETEEPVISSNEIEIQYDQPIHNNVIDLEYNPEISRSIDSDSLKVNNVDEPIIDNDLSSTIVVNPFKININTNSKLSNYENDQIEQ